LLPLLLLVACPLQAQFNLGTIAGTVRDPNGASVPKCTMTAVSLVDSSTRTALTNSDGGYSIPSLSAGRYRLTAEITGFQKSSAEVVVGVDQTITLDINLVLGNVSQQVDIKEDIETLALQRDSHEISELVTTRQLQDLPTNGRNFLSLATLGTGTQAGKDAFVTAGGPAANFGSVGREVILAGQFVGSTTFLQDGVVNVNLLTQTANIITSIESIQEASVESTGMSAKFASPGVVNVITRRGSNAFHGTVYDFLQNDALNARNFFATTVPVLRYNQFGANLGGPIVKNKLFAFFDYAGQRQTSFTTTRTRVPTDAERNGNFQGSSTVVYDPATYNSATGTISAFPNNSIPSTRFDPGAVRYLAYFPAANQPLINGINYQTSLGNTTNFDQYLGRMDYNISSKDTLYGSIQTSESPVLQPSIVNGLFGIVYQTSGTNASLQDIHVFSPSILNIARLGYNRSILFLSQQGIGAQDYVALFGLQNLNLPKDISIPPAVTVSGCCSLGSPTNPQGGTQNLFQFADEVNWTLGRHQIFFGAEVDRLQFNGTWLLYNGGQYTFTGLYTSNHLTGTNQKLGPSIGDFLLGYPSSASGGQGIPDGAFRETDVGLYVQDNWKVNKKLTLNLGLRYQYYQPTYDKWNKAAIIDLPTGTSHVGTWEPSRLNFAPRVGLAYSLNDKTVIRSGFGIYYNQQPYNFLQFLIANSPVYVLQSVTLTAATPVNWTQVFSATPGKSAQSPFTEGLQMPTPYSEQWNFGIQRSIGSGLVASVSYVGNQAHHQPLRLNPNQAIQDVNPAQPTPIANRRPYALFGDVFGQYNIQNANYHSLQASLHYRLSRGLSVAASYTYSKAMDIADAGATLPVNGLDAKGSSYGPANFNRTQLFTTNFVYELPFGTGKPFMADKGWISRQVIGGWQVSGIVVAQTGLPFEVTATDLSNTGGIHTQVANRTCNGNLPSGQRSILHWFDTTCFSQPITGTLGNSGRNALLAPGGTNFDLSASKQFPFAEQRFVQFRADFFSAFNHPLFSTGNQATNSSTYGQITSASGARVIQLSLKVVF
jgi:outer membrane receptor protein involved in Fe transport